MGTDPPPSPHSSRDCPCTNKAKTPDCGTLACPTTLYASAGDLPSSSPDFPERPEWEKEWSAKTGVELLSAYKEVEGVEPNFTNNAKVLTSFDPPRVYGDTVHLSLTG